MPETAEQLKCRCGLPMVETAAGGAWYCENCDTVQPQEIGFEVNSPLDNRVFGIEMISMAQNRRKTREDVQFDMYWLSLMDTEYEDKTRDSDDQEGNDDGS